MYSHIVEEVELGSRRIFAHVFLDKHLRARQESVFMKKIFEIKNKFSNPVHKSS